MWNEGRKREREEGTAGRKPNWHRMEEEEGKKSRQKEQKLAILYRERASLLPFCFP